MEKNKDWILMEEADWHFRKLVRRFVKERDKISVEGVSLPGLLILKTIERNGEQRLGDLAEVLDFTSGAVTALCDKLEAAGFAVRQRSRTDRRSIALNITERGRKMLLRNQEVGTCIIDLLFGTFSQEELIQQIHYFKRLNESLVGFSERIDELVGHISEGPAGKGGSPASRRNRDFISY
ncbi:MULTISPECIES: MarR family transcriptional regulator [Paenibacillus]|uniref:Transcriptional regulator, MarR family n=2 Tax=Paenibacillus lactis TaxID=228574 RepID=G4HAC9_9BACL|nr:MarR family transcriptional regulator [Paenibacillus lactis]EHB66888.1 transcriptional regulator, MarR family [Paenibacillus lactis 154]MBP1893606.1 DNA-binding MarR family transcriptional regulator [Paenibacillus lactis]MCM3491981.1 MarR family transcriptional regulator [Paenibacillus lactis]